MDSYWWMLLAIVVGLGLGLVAVTRLRGRAGRGELDRDQSLPVTDMKKYSDMSASYGWFRSTGLMAGGVGVFVIIIGERSIGLLLLAAATLALLMARHQRKWLRGHRVPSDSLSDTGGRELDES